MNYVFVSPNFPRSYSNFAIRLKEYGVTVLGIGEDAYDDLNQDLKDSLTEYYRVKSMADYDEMLRAVGFFVHKYGKIHRLESHNEHWLMQDARLRSDFNIPGLKEAEMEPMKLKSRMKEVFRNVGIPVAKGAVVQDLEEALLLAQDTGYPVVLKPDMGVGAQGTHLLRTPEELEVFFEEKPEYPCIMEEFIDGDIVSFDGLTDQAGEVVFHSSFLFSSGIMDVVNLDLDVFYFNERHVPEDLVEAGTKALKAFGLRERFFHMEFFRTKLGKLYALEVNIRPPGGYSVDMWNFSYDVDLYAQYARIVNGLPFDAYVQRNYFCAYVGRKDGHSFRNSIDEIIYRYHLELFYHGEMPKVFSKALGNYGFIFRSPDLQDLKEKVQFILDKK